MRVACPSPPADPVRHPLPAWAALPALPWGLAEELPAAPGVAKLHMPACSSDIRPHCAPSCCTELRLSSSAAFILSFM